LQTLDVISVNIWQILISLANLLVMFWLLKKFLFKPVMAIFAQRQAEIEKRYSEADAAKENALRDEREYSEKLATADEEVDAILRDARERAGRIEEEIIGEANAKAVAIKRRADADIAQEKKKAINEIKDEISSISIDIAESMISREINEEDHKELIDDFISGIGE